MLCRGWSWSWLPGDHGSAGLPGSSCLVVGTRLVGAAAGHAVGVPGLFSAVATAAGTIAGASWPRRRSPRGSMLLALLVAGITSIGRLSPASFVQAWMGFGPAGYLPTNFWSRFISSGPQLGELAGLTGIVLTCAIAAVISRWRFAADVTV